MKTQQLISSLMMAGLAASAMAQQPAALPAPGAPVPVRAAIRGSQPKAVAPNRPAPGTAPVQAAARPATPQQPAATPTAETTSKPTPVTPQPAPALPASPPAKATASASSFAQPLVTVPLLRRLSVPPALSVLVGDTIYFTEWLGYTGCRGSNFYSYHLPTHAEKLEAQLDCVSRIFTDGDELYVQTGTEENDSPSAQQLYHWQDGKLRSLVDNSAEGRLSAKVSYQLWRGLSAGQPQKLYRVFKGKIYTVAQVAVGPRSFVLLDISDVSSGTAVSTRESLLELPLTQPVKDFVTDESGAFYFVVSTAQGDRIVPVALQGSGPVAQTTLGTAPQRAKAWSTKTESEWAVRNAVFLAPSEFGFAVFDRTPRRDEERVLSLYDRTGHQFYRSNVSSPSITGLSFVDGGLLVTRGLEGDVTWYGPTNPFPPEWLNDPEHADDIFAPVPTAPGTNR